MTRRLIAIAFIFACTSIAWMYLGSTIFERTAAYGGRLREAVGSTWGTSHEQAAPTAFTQRTESKLVDGKTVETTHHVPLRLEQTRAAVAFDLDHRQKGLLWYSTYAVRFDGSFRFRNATASDSVTLAFKLPASKAIYDNLRMSLNGVPVRHETDGQTVHVTARVPLGESATLAVSYRSQGLDQWRYVLGADIAEARDFDLTMHTDFADIDFPENALSPTEKRTTPDGWDLRWKYSNLLSGFQIGMDMPQKLQPGPLAGEIAQFAPVSLLFFFAVMFIIVTIRRIDLHPMNYAFLAAAFFAFHLLLAYLVDHISIHVAFLISSIVSIALVVSYMRLVVGPRFAFREAALAQFTYLVLFSYAFFFTGFTGLAITIGSILTLFVAMQLTGRVRWSTVFAGDGSG